MSSGKFFKARVKGLDVLIGGDDPNVFYDPKATGGGVVSADGVEYVNGYCSIAHFWPDLGVVRYGEIIAKPEEIEWSDALPIVLIQTPEGVENVGTHRSWYTDREVRQGDNISPWEKIAK